MLIYLERRDPAMNMARFYAISLAPTLFGPCAVVREWGRIGSPGTVREEWYDNPDLAAAQLARIAERKRRKGYAECLETI